MAIDVSFTLSFSGNSADDYEIDFYDVAQALLGFQRSLAITTHLVLNNQVITQAPAVRNARIIATPPEIGSWKTLAKVSIVGTALYTLGTSPKDTPIGHMVSSAYDYVISETMGFHVDYDKTLGQQFEEYNRKNDKVIKPVEKQQLDSAIEKCEPAIKEMHRPIVQSKTAERATLLATIDTKEIPFEHPLNQQSYDHISYTERSDELFEIAGRVSSYNINTFKGRIFVFTEQRPIPFVLLDKAKSPSHIAKITESLTMNAQDRFILSNDDMELGIGDICLIAYKNVSRTGILKSLHVMGIKHN